MPSKSEQKETKIEVILPDGEFPRCMYFNRFRVHREGDFVLLHFGIDSASEGVLDHYRCTISHYALEQNKLSLIDYLNRCHKPRQKPLAWNRSLPATRVDVFDLFNMSFSGDVAETGLSLYPITVASRKAVAGESDVKVLALPIVLLRSSVENQMQLIVALYEE